MRSRLLGGASIVLLVALVYFALAKVGLTLAFVAEEVTAFWPPTGIALAAILIFGYRAAPGVALGAFLVNASIIDPLLPCASIAAGNTLEAVLGAWLLERYVGFQRPLARIKDAVGLVVFGAGISTLVSAIVGVSSLCAAGVHPWAVFGSLSFVWWLGDALGALVVTPLALTWTTRPWVRPRPLQVLEVAFLSAALSATVLFVFTPFLGNLTNPSLEHAIYPFIIWAALRFGPRLTTTLTAATSFVAIWGTLGGAGPFAVASASQSLILLQAFTGMLAITGLILAAANDERSRADESVRENHRALEIEHNLRLAIEDAIPSGIAAVDLDGRQTYVNRAFSQMVAWSESELLGARPPFKYWPEEELGAIQGAFAATLRGGAPHEGFELRFRKRTGELFDARVTLSPLMAPDGKVTGWLASVLDVTARKRSEKEREELFARAEAARAEAERLYGEARIADRQKDEFLAMLGHELRNPLAPIRNALHLARSRGLESASVARAHDVLDRQVANLTRLVDDLLDVSRIRRGKIQLIEKRLEFGGVVRNAVETVSPSIEARRQTLAVSIASEPMEVRGDRTRLEQVVTNLLDNASKYTEEGGRIWLSAGPEEGAVVVRVRDSGVGIPAELLPRVFDMFTQSDRALERSAGLGVGLSLVRRLVQLHGGTVTAESKGTGHGSEFIVRLPEIPRDDGAHGTTRERQDSPPGVLHVPGDRATPLRILVVDDNRDAAETLRELLEHWGNEVLVAYDGRTALEAAERFHPQVILLDIGLPDLDGYQVARTVRGLPGLGRTALIAVTGFGREQPDGSSIDVTFDRHLIKPVDPDHLASLLATLGRT